jgi:hypothetical protein
VLGDLRGIEELRGAARGVDVGVSLRARFAAGGGETSSPTALRLVDVIAVSCLDVMDSSEM